MRRIRVISCGLGAVGSKMAELILQREAVEIVGVADVAEQIIGKDLGRVIGPR